MRKNLVSSFPSLSQHEIVRIEKRFYHFLLDTVFESCKLLSVRPKTISRRMQFENIDEVNALLSAGQSVSIFMGHYANWEWVTTIGLHLPEDSLKVQIYHKLRNKVFDRFMRSLRERFGNMSVEMYHTVRFMASARADNRACIVGFIADQSPKKREVKNYLHFLNHNVAVLTGTEKATTHFGYLPMFLAVNRVKRGYYISTFSHLEPASDAKSEFPLTEAYFKRLEQEIIKAPEYYLWSHNRFKYTRPEIDD